MGTEKTYLGNSVCCKYPGWGQKDNNLQQWFSTRSSFAPQGTCNNDFHLALASLSCKTFCHAEFPGRPWRSLHVSVFAYRVLTTVKVPAAPVPLLFIPANSILLQGFVQILPPLWSVPGASRTDSFILCTQCL